MIQLCYEHGLKFSVLPGANALVPAVVGSGFDTSSFVYIGFLPQKDVGQIVAGMVKDGLVTVQEEIIAVE